MSPWVLIIAAAALEPVWALAIQASKGFTVLRPTLIAVVSAAACIYLYGKGSAVLPLTSVYVVWAGFGYVSVELAATLQGERPSLLAWALIVNVTASVIALIAIQGRPA